MPRTHKRPIFDVRIAEQIGSISRSKLNEYIEKEKDGIKGTYFIVGSKETLEDIGVKLGKKILSAWITEKDGKAALWILAQKNEG